MSALRLLLELERKRDLYGADVGTDKLRLLRALDRVVLPSASAVLRLHECLCFLRAYPDDPAVLDQVERMLARFPRRRDLRHHREDLLDTGIAGTPIYYSFYWSTARHLVRRWPERITVDWESFPASPRLAEILHLLVPYTETPALDFEEYSAREWFARLKGPRETDGAFLVRRFEKLRADEFVREAIYDGLDPFLRLDPGPDTPSRTRAKHPVARVVYQTRPLDRARPALEEILQVPPRDIHRVSRAEGERLIDHARESMVTRARDLDAFAHADPRDVFLVDFGHGLRFAGMGMVPERRLLLESVYGFLTLKNGVPIGYVLASALFRSSEVAYNVFETFRGGESAAIFGRVLSMIRHVFGSESFTLDPYQLGYGNDEGLRSGAWWFYYKMGFRPFDPGVWRVLRAELTRMERQPAHRSSRSTLEHLASENMFYSPGPRRRDVLGRVNLGAIGLAASKYLAHRFGSDREEGIRISSREAAELLRVGSFRGWTTGERLAWERWSPLVLVLPDLPAWNPSARRDLVEVIRAKGGRSERDYVERVNRHAPLMHALLALAERRGARVTSP
jgi:hypothetical protein